MMNTILHVVYIALFVVVINGQTCEPCKENNPRTISFISRNVSSSVNQFIWISEGVTAAVCYSQNGLECLLNPEARGLLSSTIEKKPDDVVNTSVTFTANRLKKLTSETKWELKVLDDHQSLKQLYTCDVKIYRSVPLPSCNYEASHKGLEVKCFSPFVYPTSVCSFNVRFVQTILNQMAVHYNHSITNTDPIYYTTECSLSVPQHLLMPGVLKYQVTMFPNITTTSATFSIKELEKTAKDTINIEFPSIKMVACPDIVEVGSIFNCTCERNDQSDIPTEVYWYGSQTTNVLSKITVEYKTVYVCKAENLFGWLSILYYSPTTKENKSSNELALFSGKLSNSSNEYRDKELFLKGQNQNNLYIIFGAVVALLFFVIVILMCIFKKTVEGLQPQLKQPDKEKGYNHQPSAANYCQISDNAVNQVSRGTTEEPEANYPLLPESSNSIEQPKFVPKTQCNVVSNDSLSKSSNKTSVIVKFAAEGPHGSVRLREAEVSLDASILLLKQDLVDLYNIPAQVQLWYLKNKLMEDDALLRDYDISESDTILMKAKQPTVKRERGRKKE